MATRKKDSVSAVMKMSVSERILAVEEIWDSIAKSPESIPVSSAEKKELDRRLKAMSESPDAGSPWSEARGRIRSQK